MSGKEAGNNPGLYPVEVKLPIPVNVLAESSLAKCLRLSLRSPIKNVPFPEPSVACLSESPVQKPSFRFPSQSLCKERGVPFPKRSLTCLHIFQISR